MARRVVPQPARASESRPRPLVVKLTCCQAATSSLMCGQRVVIRDLLASKAIFLLLDQRTWYAS